MGSFFSLQGKKIKKIASRFFVLLTMMIVSCFTVINPISVKVSQSKFCSVASAIEFPNIKNIVKSLFGKKEKKPVLNEKVMVYLGGYPLGFTFKCNGVLVVAISNENASNLIEGDIIKKINNFDVFSVEDISDVLNNKIKSSEELELLVLRKNEEQIAKLKPIFDSVTKEYKLGLWIRDDAAGVGTITYIRKDNLRFGALGHPVCDIDTGSIMPGSSGNIFKCNIVGFKKGNKNDPGELKGLFLRNGSVLGELDKNYKSGVYGKFNNEKLDLIEERIVEVADRNEIKSGKATIRCTIDGYEPQEYEIEIVKTYFQTGRDTKSMFIRVTDKELLARTGGIVQGMSGSPIIQNGKLVGAVTHVFVSDPTKGYGIFADLMINN